MNLFEFQNRLSVLKNVPDETCTTLSPEFSEFLDGMEKHFSKQLNQPFMFEFIIKAEFNFHPRLVVLL